MELWGSAVSLSILPVAVGGEVVGPILVGVFETFRREEAIFIVGFGELYMKAC